MLRVNPLPIVDVGPLHVRHNHIFPWPVQLSPDGPVNSAPQWTVHHFMNPPTRRIHPLAFLRFAFALGATTPDRMRPFVPGSLPILIAEITLPRFQTVREGPTHDQPFLRLI